MAFRVSSIGVKTSIVIPVLNEARRLKAAVDRAWATGPHEVIVVDGGSTDATAEIARQTHCVFLHGRRGRAVQQNVGAERATGDVLLFLHADNWLTPGGLRQIEHALANPRIGGGAFRHRIEAEGWIYRVIERGNLMRARVLQMIYGDQGIFVRRSMFEQLGGFPDVQLMEDMLLVRKLAQHTPLVLLDGPLFISARRWQRHGPVRQTAVNWALTAAELSGIAPQRLAPFFPDHRDDSPNGG